MLAQLGLVYCAAIWGSTFFVVRDAVETVHPVTLVGYRFTLAAILLLPLLLARRQNPFAGMTLRFGLRTPLLRETGGEVTSHASRAGIILGPGLALGLVLWLLYVAQTWGLTVTTAANSGFITGLFIVFVPFIAWLLDRSPVPWPKLAAVGIATAGLYLLTGGIAGLNSGDVLTLLAAVTYALHVLLTGRYTSRPHDAFVLCFQQVMVTGLLSLLSAWLMGWSFDIGSAPAGYAIVFLTVFPTLSAFLIQLIAQRRVDPLRTALIFVLEPVFGALFSWTLGGEQFKLLAALGGGLIVLAMLISELPYSKRDEIIDEHALGS
jgi:drug/metabolite transporter (DMT)-like permease